MADGEKPNLFRKMTFDDYRELARDDSLTPIEKVGFPQSYRAGKEEAIFADIRRKLSNLEQSGKLVLDIGPGCSVPAQRMIELCRERGHTLILVDSAEMLAHLPDAPFITKVPARFPEGCSELFEKHAAGVDVINAYSVLHPVYADGNVYHFVDRALGLLAHRGQLLLGDISNTSMRARFFGSPDGLACHREYTGDPDAVPDAPSFEPGSVDDAVVLSLVQRCRHFGYHAWVVPQAPDAPLSNRREDILVVRP